MRGRRKTKPKLYYIEWQDPASEHQGWFDLTDEEIDKLLPGEVKSVGWIIKENDKFIVIISSLIEKDEIGGGDTTILKSLITKKIPITLECS